MRLVHRHPGPPDLLRRGLAAHQAPDPCGCLSPASGRRRRWGRGAGGGPGKRPSRRRTGLSSAAVTQSPSSGQEDFEPGSMQADPGLIHTMGSGAAASFTKADSYRFRKMVDRAPKSGARQRCDGDDHGVVPLEVQSAVAACRRASLTLRPLGPLSGISNPWRTASSILSDQCPRSSPQGVVPQGRRAYYGQHLGAHTRPLCDQACRRTTRCL